MNLSSQIEETKLSKDKDIKAEELIGRLQDELNEQKTKNASLEQKHASEMEEFSNRTV